METAKSTSQADYYEWNERLARHFFHEAHAYRQVHLAVDAELIGDLGGTPEEFAEAALEESEELNCETVEELGLKLLDQWCRGVESQPSLALDDVPPFIGVLGLLVLAVNHGEGRYSPHQYYERLHELLGNPPTRIDEIRRSLRMWKELAHWSTNTCNGRLGYFDVGILGQHRFVGVPRRQILIAPREKPALFRAMLGAGIAPHSDVRDARIASVLRTADGILARTKKLASEWPKSEISQELVDEVRNQLSTASDSALEIGQPEASLSIPLRLALQVEKDHVVAALVEAELALDDDQEEIQLTLKVPGVSDATSAPQELWLSSGRSNTRPIVVDARHDPSWVTEDLWFADLRIEIEGRNGALVRRRQREIIFRPSDAVDTLEEIHPADLRAGDSYLLARPVGAQDASQPAFVSSFVGDWRTYRIAPSIFFRPFVAASSKGDAVRSHPRIRLLGGIRTEATKNSFLSFALPEIYFESVEIDESSEALLRQHDADGRLVGGVTRLRIEPVTFKPMLGIERAAEFETRHTARLTELSPACAVCRVELHIDGDKVADAVFFVDEHTDLSEVPEIRPTDGLGFPSEQGAAEDSEVPEAAEKRGNPPVAMHPVRRGSLVEPDGPSRILMHLLRARKRLSWQQAKAWLPSCIPHASSRSFESRYLMHELMALHALGVAELEYGRDGGIRSVACLPPKISILPRLANLGLDERQTGRLTASEAILTGAWTPDELSRLYTEASRARIEILESNPPPDTSLVPNRRSLIVEGDYAAPRLTKLADAIGVQCDTSRFGLEQVATALLPIESLSSRPDWTPGVPAASLLKRYFDPRKIGTTKNATISNDRYQVWECRHRDRNVWTNFVVDVELNRRLLVSDRQVARWFVRRRYVPDSPIPITHDTAFVPAELRLPRILERALCMSSGHGPELQRYLRGDSPFENDVISEHFAIPGPPAEPVPWLSFRDSCCGNFVCYPEAYGSTLWSRTDTIPMLDLAGETVNGLGLGRR